MQQQATEYLNNIQNDLAQKGIKLKPKVIKSELGEVAKKIIQIAHSEDTDLIIVATHGRTGVSHWMYGSVANKLVDESTQPLLLVRPEIPE